MSRLKAWRARAPRMVDWVLYAAILLLLIWHVAPQNLPVVLYKLALVALAGIAGYYLDRSIFPYARPDQIQNTGQFDNLDLIVATAMIRRAIIVAAAMIAISLGL